MGKQNLQKHNQLKNCIDMRKEGGQEGRTSLMFNNLSWQTWLVASQVHWRRSPVRIWSLSTNRKLHYTETCYSKQPENSTYYWGEILPVLPVLPDSSQLLHYIQITTYFHYLVKSSLVTLEASRTVILAPTVSIHSVVGSKCQKEWSHWWRFRSCLF